MADAEQYAATIRRALESAYGDWEEGLAALAALLEQQQQHEAKIAAELGLRLATERLLDEARRALQQIAAPSPRREFESPSDAVRFMQGVARDALARLGAAAPQQEPATSGDPLDGLAGSKLADAELEFLSASIAVWEEIDQHIDDDGHYVAGVPESLSPSNELRRRELEAWRRYRDLRWPSGGVSGVNET